MERVFNSACKVPTVKHGEKLHQTTAKNLLKTKTNIQHLFKIQLKLRVFFVRKGSGTSNTGNVAQNF